MTTHDELVAKMLSNQKVKAEYDALEDEFSLLRQLIQARNAAGMSQVDVARKMGTKQSAIARIEASGKHSLSLKTLRRYAKAVGYKLDVRLVKMDKSTQADYELMEALEDAYWGERALAAEKNGDFVDGVAALEAIANSNVVSMK